jgi:hypothetical protein
VRVLLDEQLPVGLAGALAGHQVDTVVGLGWQGVTNGELLRRARDRYDAFITMDRNLEYQQNLGGAGVGVVLVRARSNRLNDLVPLVPRILEALNGLTPGELRRVGA